MFWVRLLWARDRPSDANAHYSPPSLTMSERSAHTHTVTPAHSRTTSDRSYTTVCPPHNVRLHRHMPFSPVMIQHDTPTRSFRYMLSNTNTSTRTYVSSGSFKRRAPARIATLSQSFLSSGVVAQRRCRPAALSHSGVVAQRLCRTTALSHRGLDAQRRCRTEALSHEPLQWTHLLWRARLPRWGASWIVKRWLGDPLL